MCSVCLTFSAFCLCMRVLLQLYTYIPLRISKYGHSSCLIASILVSFFLHQSILYKINVLNFCFMNSTSECNSCVCGTFFWGGINTPTKPKKARCQKHISSLLAETLNSYFWQLHKCSNIKAAVPLSGGYFGLAGLIGLL